MRTKPSLVPLLVVGIAICSCGKQEAAATAAANETAAPPPAAGAGKIPVTTSSPQAKAEFLEGRDMQDKLLITDSVQHFQKAASLDPDFALAELSLANTAPTGKEFFEHLHKAVGLAGKASDGERLLILATEAGANANAVKQQEYLEQLVARYPNDERAHFNLGGYYFGQQEFPKAIEHYRRATEIEPAYSSAYNLLGYAYRQHADYANSEKAFQRYIELIPKDPNPYDSYAELLLKMGRFDDSIAQYRKALAIDSNFVNAHQGIAMDLLYSGKPDQAAGELQTFLQKARTDGERQTALFALMVVHLDGGQMARAQADLDQQQILAGKTNDVPAIVFRHGMSGTVFLEMGKPDQAKAEFESGLKAAQASSLSQEFKDNAKLASRYNFARVAVARKDFAGAEREAAEFRKGSEATKNPAQIKVAHELDGIVALAQKNYDKAVAELQQANQQNPYNLYRMCLALEAKGDKDKARNSCAAAAHFNTLPNMNYALVRTKAKAVAEKKG